MAAQLTWYFPGGALVRQGSIMNGLLVANEQSQAGPERPDSTKQDRKLQVGIDSFASQFVDHGAGDEASASNGIRHLVERIELADQVSLDVFGVGEHHRK